MAIVAGAGNPAGSGGTAGVGTSLNYIGDHAYAFSGVVNDSSSGSAATTALKFSTGSNYIVGTIDMIIDETLNNQQYVDVRINGESVFKGSWDAEPNQLSGRPLTQIILPSYADCEIKWGSSADRNATIIFVGRVY